MPMPMITKSTVVSTLILWTLIVSPWNSALVISVQTLYLDGRHETKIEPFQDGVHINWYSTTTSKMHQQGY